MAKTIAFDQPFRKGERVTATVALRGVPEGTAGRVKLINGLTWTRYWVFFENGVDLGSIDQTALVRSKQWAAYQVHRTELASRAEEAEAAPAAAGGGGDAAAAPTTAADGADSRVPEHLLERAKRRREQLGI